MQTVSRAEAKRIIEERDDVTVVEVLGTNSFKEFHLPGAKNVPLDEAFEQHIQRLAPDKSRPVLVYCMDAECPAAPKAAERLEKLGYRQVYGYEAGKVDWKEAGLPVEEGRFNR